MSVLRISSIASGLDTEQVVRDLMRIERMKVDKLYQERQTIRVAQRAVPGIRNQPGKLLPGHPILTI